MQISLDLECVSYLSIANSIQVKEPEFVEGDVFRIIVPLDEEYSFDFGVNNKSVSETLG